MYNAAVLPAVIQKIATNSAGGWTVRLDVPESAADIVRGLLGTENTLVYAVAFSSTGECLTKPRRGPGRPKKDKPAQE